MSSKQKLVGNLSRGLVFVVSAPAGTGKTTLVNRLTQEFPGVEVSISCTTRLPRAGEQDGVHYHFLNEADFSEQVKEGKFLEHVTLFGYRYGTNRLHVEEKLALGKHVFLVIDTQGAIELMGRFPAIFIFLMPPSFEVLAQRLEARGTENAESLSMRLDVAQQEIVHASSYHYVIVNDDLETSYQVLRSIVIAEEHRARF